MNYLGPLDVSSWHRGRHSVSDVEESQPHPTLVLNSVAISANDPVWAAPNLNKNIEKIAHV